MSEYFLAVTPDNETSAKVEQLQEKYCKGIGKQMFPHVTIYPPFVLKIDEKELVSSLEIQFKGTAKESVRADGVGFFDNQFEGRTNNVIYLAPDRKSTSYLGVLNDIAIETIEPKVRAAYKDYKTDKQSFIPHLTLATKIPTEEFLQAKRKIQDIPVNLSFKVDSVFLYKYNNVDKKWQDIKVIRF